MNIMNRTILCACLVTGTTLSLSTQSSQSSADVISATAAQASGPDGRQITDPRTLTSESSPAARPIPIDDLYFTRSLGGASWSPDGKEILLTTDISGRMNLWKVSAGGGWPLQLSQSDERQFNGAWSPDGKWIVFQQDVGGNELWDIFAIPRDGGEATNLTATPGVREEGPRWSPDGKTLAINRKPKESTVYDIALLDWATRTITPLTHESTPNHLWQSVGWSPDGRMLYANRLDVSFQDADAYAIEVATGTATNLTPHQGQALYLASSVSPDGKTLLLTSNVKSGYQNVALLHLPKQPLTWVTDTKWEATAGDFSPNGKSFTYAINADGRTDLFLVDAAKWSIQTNRPCWWRQRLCRFSNLVFAVRRQAARLARELGRSIGLLGVMTSRRERAAS